MKRLEPSVHLEAVVDAPPSAVLDVLADWRKNLLWEQELRVSEPVTPEPFRVGTRCAGFGSPALAHRRRGDHRVRAAPAAGQ